MGCLAVKRRLIIRLFRLLLLVSNLEHYLVVSYSLQYPLFDDVAFDKRCWQSDETQGCARGFRSTNGTLQGHCLSPRFSCRESAILNTEGANVQNPNPSCSSAQRSPEFETGFADGDLLSCSPGYSCSWILFDPLSFFPSISNICPGTTSSCFITTLQAKLHTQCPTSHLSQVV